MTYAPSSFRSGTTPSASAHPAAQTAQRLTRANQFAHWARFAGRLLHFCQSGLAPALDLAIRLWLAQIFWLSGLVKLANWDTALALAANEYPLSWLDPVTAAYLGAAIELLCPILLALGLATRFAAVPLLLLALIIQFNYLALNEHLFWAALFGWYVVMGAGALSLDRLLGRGLADSALPFTTPLQRLLTLLTARIGPLYQLFLRSWLGFILLAGSFGLISGGVGSWLHYAYQTPLLPSSAPLWLTLALTGAVPLLLLAGLTTRLVALVVLLALGSTHMAMNVTELQRIDHVYWSLLFALLLAYGPGRLSLDQLLLQRLRQRFPQLDGRPAADLATLPQVVIVGAGFGGMTAARALTSAACRVTLIDRHNYHLFQPLLYQVATASLSPGDIATPIRALLREQFNARVLLGNVTAIDTDEREVIMGERRLPYDYLILATGARHAYFGRDEWEDLAPGLKQIDDATRLRRRLLLAFEQAENATDPIEQQRLLTFVIVGGGPTGVELAGAIAELAHHGLAQEFRMIDPGTARILLIQAGPRLLPAFPERLSLAAAASLQKLGVEVLTDSRVEQIDKQGVVVNHQRIESQTVFWAAGVMASPAARWLGADSDNAGRIKVAADLSVAGLENIFAIGDTALSTAWNGQPVPGLAPAAKQGGQYVAAVIRAHLQGKRPPAPFRYRHLGSLATIGRKAAVADFGRLRLHGAPAWWLWGVIHVMFLAGMRNRVLVALQWFWAYLTFKPGTRLITGAAEQALPAPRDSSVAAVRPELKLARGND